MRSSTVKVISNLKYVHMITYKIFSSLRIHISVFHSIPSKNTLKQEIICKYLKVYKTVNSTKWWNLIWILLVRLSSCPLHHHFHDPHYHLASLLKVPPWHKLTIRTSLKPAPICLQNSSLSFNNKNSFEIYFKKYISEELYVFDSVTGHAKPTQHWIAWEDSQTSTDIHLISNHVFIYPHNPEVHNIIIICLS